MDPLSAIVAALVAGAAEAAKPTTVCAVGLLGRAAAESGRLGHGDWGHGRGDRRRRAFMLMLHTLR